jgi:gliding motility-associated-like protein
VAAPSDNTTYFLTVIDPGGCTASASQLVLVETSRGVYIPNAFSPNADGINDVFMIFSDGYSVKNIRSFLIFSRWGETVHEYYNFLPDNPAFGWDGKHRNKTLNSAVFTWFADIEFLDGSSQLYKGDVTLVR